MTGIPPPPQLLTPNLFLSHIRYRGRSLGSDHIPGSEPSPRTARQNMLTISYQIRCKSELMKGMSYRGRVSQKKRWAEAIQSVKGCGKKMDYFKNYDPQHQTAKALQMSSCTVQNIIKRFRETGEISLLKEQGRRPLLDVDDCITHRHDSVIDFKKCPDISGIWVVCMYVCVYIYIYYIL